MGPRIILYTGKGGVGKTSVAACTARACAAAGMRTLIVSTDPAHSLSESLAVQLGPEPVGAAELLWGQEINAQEELERHWAGVQDWLGDLLVQRGVDRISAQELTVPPGMDELFALLALQGHAESAAWDAVIVDCAPTGETLRLLSFPDVARWWLEKIFPIEGQLLAAARPIARTLLDISLPGEEAFADVHRLSRQLIAFNETLRDTSRCTVRLVMNPDRLVIGEAMRTYTYLSMYGYLTDAVVVNRMFPVQVGDYFAAWRRVQEEHLELVHSAFTPLPVLCAPYFEQEVVGPGMLDRLRAELFDGIDAAAVLADGPAQEIEVHDDGATIRLAVPLVDKGEVTLRQLGSELILGVSGQRRTISLPPAMATMRATEARFEQGALHVKLNG